MGTVSGFVIEAPGAPSVYLAGDTIWCPEVAQTIERHQPEVVVVNAGAAQFEFGGPITMTATDVAAVCRAAPKAHVVAVHMDAINHCRLTRQALRAHLDQEGLSERVLIPADGETLEFGRSTTANRAGTART
ncbi:Beta-lactamase superfamily domain protein [compost metagenome]